MIKLQRAYWTDTTKSVKSNLGSSLELPETFSISAVNVSRSIDSFDRQYNSRLKVGSYNRNSIVITGVIYLEGSYTNAEALKDDILTYVNSIEGTFMKIFQNANDTKHWLGIISNTDVTYEARRSLINMTLTFDLEEPFRLDDTLTVVTVATDTGDILISNDSNIEFYPEKVVVTGTTFSVKPVYDTAAAFKTELKRVTSPTNDTFYVKEFSNMTDLDETSLSNLIKIPAGDFYVKEVGTLSFYKRWL